MDGRMDKTIDTIKYLCVFAAGPCPVRMQFKLQPENLLEYCKICHLNPSNKQEPRQESMMFYDALARFVPDFLQLLQNHVEFGKREKAQLLDIIKIMSNKQTQ